MTSDAIANLRADLANARALRATRLSELQTLQNSAVDAERKKDEIENQLRNIRTLLKDIEPRTNALKSTLERKQNDVSAAESRLIERESKLGIAGIPPADAIKTPKDQFAAGAVTRSVADEKYLEMKRREDAGEVPNGTAFKLWRSLTAAANVPASGGSHSSNNNSKSNWGQRIVSGHAD